MTAHALGDIASRFGLELRGDPATPIRGVATLANANDDQLGFLANPRYRTQLATTKAAAIVARAADAVETLGDQGLEAAQRVFN